MKKMFDEQAFTTINRRKRTLSNMRELDNDIIMKTWISIYDRLNNCIEAKGCLTNH